MITKHFRACIILGVIFCLGAADLSADERLSDADALVEYERLGQRVVAQREAPNQEKLASIIAEARGLLPKVRAKNLFWNVIFGASELVSDREKKGALLREISALSGPGLHHVAQDAKEVHWAHETVGQPFELKFVAHDGRQVDLQKMKGKVVLIYFCASWCPPCVKEAAGIKAVYDRHQEKGFEVIGISLDEDEKSFLAYSKRQGFPWPQKFTADKSWEQELMKKNFVRGIPTLWLVDQKGRLADVHAREGLEGRVKKLLSVE